MWRLVQPHRLSPLLRELQHHRFFCLNTQTNIPVKIPIPLPETPVRIKSKTKRRCTKSITILSLPLLSVSGPVYFPFSEANFQISEPKYNVMFDKVVERDPPLFGVITEFSSRTEADHEYVRKHEELLSSQSAPDLFFFQGVRKERMTYKRPHGKQKYSVVPNSFTQDLHDFESEHEENKTTEWRCADIGTLIRVSKFVTVPDFIDKPKSKSKTTARLIDGIALQRFRVRSYKRSLCGYWLADVEVLKEEWGVGGQKRAIELMETLRSLLQFRLFSIVEKDVQKQLLEETNPIHFAFLIPQVLPLFGVSSLTIQAILQSKTCIDTLTMEISIVKLLDAVFSRRGGGGEEKQTIDPTKEKEEK